MSKRGTREDRKQYEQLARTFLTETDRGCILLAAGLLDDALAELLASYMRDDEPEARETRHNLIDRPLAPLGTFFARIAAAYAFALIPHGLYVRLDALREARNRAAHRYEHVDLRREDIGKLGLTADAATDELEHARIICSGEDPGEALDRIVLMMRTMQMMGLIDRITDALKHEAQERVARAETPPRDEPEGPAGESGG